MINSVISYLNTRLSLTNLFEYSYPLCELIHQGEQVKPMHYCTSGEWKEVSNFDQFNGTSYFRKDGKITQKIIEGNVSCNKYQSIEIPLKLVCVVPRTKMIDNAYTEDSIAAIINANLTTNSSLLKSTLNARKVLVTVEDYETNGNTILNQEYENVRLTDLRFEVAYVSLSVKVEVEIDVNCIILECDTEDACTQLLRSLTTDEKLGCILPDYDFSNAIVYGNLTAQQLIDLSVELCVPVNVYKSNGTTLVISLTTPQSYSIPKHTISDSALTVLYSKEFDENTTITDSTVLIKNSANTLLYTKTVKAQATDTQVLADKIFTDSDGTPSALIQGLDYTCTPAVALTCAALNTALSQTIRNQINQINLLKTGCTTSFRTGDDGDLEKGRLTSFLVLPCNNEFGNTDRFTDSLGAQLYGSGNAALTNYVIDHATGLGWYRLLQGPAIWNTAIDNSEAFATHFTDWRMSNRSEIESIFNLELTRILNYAPFSLGGGAAATVTLWTSNTNINATTNAIFVYINSTSVSLISLNSTVTKGGTSNYLMCRNHY